MLDFKNSDKKMRINLIVVAVAAMFVLVTAIVMIFSKRYMRLTIGADFVIRWLLLFACGGCYLFGLVRLALLSLGIGDPQRTVPNALLFFALAEVGVIAVVVLTFLGDADYQQNMRLIEDVLYIVFHLIIGVVSLFGALFKGDRRKTFVVSVLCAAPALVCAFLDLAFIGAKTLRDYDFVFVLGALVAIFPYGGAVAASRCLLAERATIETKA